MLFKKIRSRHKIGALQSELPSLIILWTTQGVLYLSWLAPGFAVSNTLGLISNSTQPRSLDTRASPNWVDTAALPLVTGELSLRSPKGLYINRSMCLGQGNRQGHGSYRVVPVGGRTRRPGELEGEVKECSDRQCGEGGLQGAWGEQPCLEHPVVRECSKRWENKSWFLRLLRCYHNSKWRALQTCKWGLLTSIRWDKGRLPLKARSMAFSSTHAPLQIKLYKPSSL